MLKYWLELFSELIKKWMKQMKEIVSDSVWYNWDMAKFNFLPRIAKQTLHPQYLLKEGIH